MVLESVILMADLNLDETHGSKFPLSKSDVAFNSLSGKFFFSPERREVRRGGSKSSPRYSNIACISTERCKIC